MRDVCARFLSALHTHPNVVANWIAYLSARGWSPGDRAEAEGALRSIAQGAPDLTRVTTATLQILATTVLT